MAGAYRQAAEGTARTDRQAREGSDDPLKLVIVRDMWLTGFDAPCMHTMYVDKPMKGHGLMQAIARVNRVFRDKPAGLVVDYIGIAQNLKSALGQYSPGDRRQTGIDEARGRRVMIEKYEIVRAMFRPDTKAASTTGRLCGGRDAARAPRDHGRRDRLGAHVPAGGRRQGDHRGRQKAGAPALRRRRRGLSKAFALAAASDEARESATRSAFFRRSARRS